METKFNFNSQICTSRSQSERLLSLGLKKETADMSWIFSYHWECFVGNPEELYTPDEDGCDDVFIPAWSLHRLIEMIPEYFADTKLEFRIEAVKWLMKQEGNVYDNLVTLIEDCIKNGILNKEYLV